MQGLLAACKMASSAAVLAHLVCAKVDVPWQADDIVVGVRRSLAEELCGCVPCHSTVTLQESAAAPIVSSKRMHNAARIHVCLLTIDNIRFSSILHLTENLLLANSTGCSHLT